MTDGYAKVSRAILQSRRLTAQAKLVYALLQAHADEEGRCWPSLALLIEESGWSKPTVIKAIDELVAVGVVDRKRRGQTQVNVYLLKSSTFTSEPLADEAAPSALKSTELTSARLKSSSFTSRSKARLPLKSTTFTAEVNHVDPNESHLTSITEREVPETRGRSAAAATPPALPESLEPEPMPVVAVPEAREPFDSALQGLPGYCPTSQLFSRVLEKYRCLDLEEEAIKMADWLRQPKPRKEKRECSSGFVLGWLGRALKDHAPPSRAGPNGHGNGYRRNGLISRQDFTDDDLRAGAHLVNMRIDPASGDG